MIVKAELHLPLVVTAPILDNGSPFGQTVGLDPRRISGRVFRLFIVAEQYVAVPSVELERSALIALGRRRVYYRGVVPVAGRIDRDIILGIVESPIRDVRQRKRLFLRRRYRLFGILRRLGQSALRLERIRFARLGIERISVAVCNSRDFFAVRINEQSLSVPWILYRTRLAFFAVDLCVLGNSVLLSGVYQERPYRTHTGKVRLVIRRPNREESQNAFRTLHEHGVYRLYRARALESVSVALICEVWRLYHLQPLLELIHQIGRRPADPCAHYENIRERVALIPGIHRLERISRSLQKLRIGIESDQTARVYRLHIYRVVAYALRRHLRPVVRLFENGLAVIFRSREMAHVLEYIVPLLAFVLVHAERLAHRYYFLIYSCDERHVQYRVYIVRTAPALSRAALVYRIFPRLRIYL